MLTHSPSTRALRVRQSVHLFKIKPHDLLMIADNPAFGNVGLCLFQNCGRYPTD
jgi:hypothetical protein